MCEKEHWCLVVKLSVLFLTRLLYKRQVFVFVNFARVDLTAAPVFVCVNAK